MGVSSEGLWDKSASLHLCMYISFVLWKGYNRFKGGNYESTNNQLS
jgi:hypothetical protein